MGVRKLNSFLMNKGLVKRYSSLSEYVSHIKDNPGLNNCKSGNVVIAIDFWLYTHKFLHSNKSSNIVLAFLNQIIRIMTSGGIPVYVADGNIPIEKEDEVIRRQAKRDNMIDEYNELNDQIDQIYSSSSDSYEDTELIKIKKKERLGRQLRRASRSEIRDILELFEILNIRLLRANYEADALCTRMYCDGMITTCLTDDMDMLALGCGSNIRIVKGEVFEYELDHILQSLKITQEQLIDICIIFGCGYLKHPIRVDVESTYDMIRVSGSLLDAMFSGDYPEFSVESLNTRVIGENYHDVKDIYLESPKREKRETDIELPIFNMDDVIDYLRRVKWFNSSAKNIRHAKFDMIRIMNVINGNRIINNFN